MVLPLCLENFRSLLTQPCLGSTSFLSSSWVLRTTTPNRSEKSPQTTLFCVGVVLGVLYAVRAISSSFQSTKTSYVCLSGLARAHDVIYDVVPGTDSNNGASPSPATASHSRRKSGSIGMRISMRRRGEHGHVPRLLSPFTGPYVDLNGLYHRGLVKALGAATVGPQSRKQTFLPRAED